jgi:hypothetical protein
MIRLARFHLKSGKRFLKTLGSAKPWGIKRNEPQSWIVKENKI